MDWYSDRPHPIILGHRGASAEAPENTMAAFELALSQGAAGFEFDVQQSADGELFILHDFDLSRTTDGYGPVARTPAADIAALDAGQGEAVPTLDHLFQAFGARPLYNLEIKSLDWRDQGLERRIAACILRHGLESQVLISSFNPLALRRIRRYLPSRTPLGILRDRPPLAFGHYLIRTQADHPHQAMINRRLVRRAERRGTWVIAWTVDDPERARVLARLGVTGLISNRPGLIRASLPSRA